jgi:hypothetical protein
MRESAAMVGIVPEGGLRDTTSEGRLSLSPIREAQAVLQAAQPRSGVERASRARGGRPGVWAVVGQQRLVGVQAALVLLTDPGGSHPGLALDDRVAVDVLVVKRRVRVLNEGKLLQVEVVSPGTLARAQKGGSDMGGRVSP